MTMGTQPVTNKMSITIIWISMVIACIIYWVIADYFLSTLSGSVETYILFRNPLTVVGFITMLVGIYFGWGKTRPKDDEYPGAYIQRAVTSLIVCWAAFEAVAIYGLVLHFMGDPYAHRLFIGVGFMLVLIAGSRIGPVLSSFESLEEMEDARRF